MVGGAAVYDQQKNPQYEKDRHQSGDGIKKGKEPRPLVAIVAVVTAAVVEGALLVLPLFSSFSELKIVV